MKTNMQRKISSDLTVLFQIAFLIKFITLSIVALIILFVLDLTGNLIVIIAWVAWLLFLRQIGITKLKTVYRNKHSLSVGLLNSKKEIPFSSIKDIKQAFIFDSLPFKIQYVESGKVKQLYFLPKAKILQNIFTGNALIEEIRKEIKSKRTKS